MRSAHSVAFSVAVVAFAFGCAHPPLAAEKRALPPGEIELTSEQSQAARIEVAPVSEQAVDDTLTTTGRVTFDDLRVAHIYSPITGRVVKISAQLGQHVKKGEPLAVIESPDIGSAVSDVHKAEADLVAAEHDFKRRQELYEQSAGARADMEAAEDTYRKAKAELERARQKAFLLRSGSVDAVTQTYSLVSPIDGDVIMRQVNPGIEVQGQYNNPSVAVELFTVGQLDRVWVTGDVYESDVARVKQGARVTVRVAAYRDRAFDGVIDWVSGALDPTTRTARIRCALDNRDGSLKPEMYASMQIAVDERRALAIPRDAVVKMGDTPVVFLQTGEADGKRRFERTPVSVDDVDTNSWLVVLHGLEPGQRIVTSGTSALAAKF